jgi:hypothetical protein
MVRVVSRESLRLPDTITGHVLLKNELCTKGVLAINIGVVDPGFNGPISSTLINFGRETCSVEKGTHYVYCPSDITELHLENEGTAGAGRLELTIDAFPGTLSGSFAAWNAAVWPKANTPRNFRPKTKEKRKAKSGSQILHS